MDLPYNIISWIEQKILSAGSNPAGCTIFFGGIMYKIHDGCFFNLKEITAVWSEKYSDPKFDDECYLVRSFFRNNSTILTLANFSSKKKADDLIKNIHEKIKEDQTNY